MKDYIGVKLVQAEPETRHKEGGGYEAGYKVVYPDGYVSWSPKEVFEKAYLEVGENRTVTQDMVNQFIEATVCETYGEKTAVVHMHLVNGFVLTDASSCVDPINYDLQVGSDIAIRRLKDKVWGYLGFLLQCGVKGVRRQ